MILLRSLLNTPDIKQVLSPLTSWSMNVPQPDLNSGNYSSLVIICPYSWRFSLYMHNLVSLQRLTGDPYRDFWSSQSLFPLWYCSLQILVCPTFQTSMFLSSIKKYPCFLLGFPSASFEKVPSGLKLGGSSGSSCLSSFSRNQVLCYLLSNV